MKRLYVMKLVLPVLVVVAAVTSCSSQDCKPDYTQVNVTEFEKGLAETDIVVLDVRTPEEFAQGHLPNAVNINYYDGDVKEQLAKLDKEKAVYIYCKSGSRSSKSSAILKGLCFSKVREMDGGIMAWMSMSKPVER